MAEAEQRLHAMDSQIEDVNGRIAAIEVSCSAAGEASEGPDLTLLHKKPVISKKLQDAVDQQWPEKAVTEPDMAFHADDSIVAAIMGLGEVAGGVNEDPEATALEELKEVMAEADHVFEDADKDNDGLIDAMELKQLMFFLYTKGGSYPHDLAARIKEEVEATMDRFDVDHDQLISKPEFYRMLCSNPWKILLPEKARANATLMKHYFAIEQV